MFKPSLSSLRQETLHKEKRAHSRTLQMHWGSLSLQEQLRRKFAKVLQRFRS